MKRFTEALKWRDPWFRELSIDAKLVFWYFVDNCDAAGVWEPDFPMVNFCLKRDVDWELVWREFGDRVAILPGGKLWMRKFVAFQYGSLTETCAPHRTVINLVAKHGLTLMNGKVTLNLPHKYPPPRVKEEEEEEDKAKVHSMNGTADHTPPAAVANEETARRPLMDALAILETPNLAEVTDWPRHAKALKQIRGVTPDVTPAEIARRATNYPTHMSGAMITSNALAKHWGMCNEAGLGRSSTGKAGWL